MAERWPKWNGGKVAKCAAMLLIIMVYFDFDFDFEGFRK